MQAALASAMRPGPAPREQAAGATLEALRQRHHRTLRMLAEVTERAERAERRLRHRLLELTWPAALGGIAGGFAAVLLLRLWGL